MKDISKLLVIVGPTASGKTSLALEIAEKFNGEIICADSRTVYKGMDIGTAKPTATERARVPHHLLDVVNPDDLFTVADFKRLALVAIEDIAARGRLPILVGGSGLYVDAVIFDYEFKSPPDPSVRASLEELSVDELQELIKIRGLAMPNNDKNPRHLTRVIETNGQVPVKHEMRVNTEVVGLQVDNVVLKERIFSRTHQMIQDGLVDEVKQLEDTFGADCRALQTPGYRPFIQYLHGHMTLQDAIDLFIKNDYQLARRQKTWFKRNLSIHWMDDPKSYVDTTTTLVNKLR